jgi:hypothetical protein
MPAPSTDLAAMVRIGYTPSRQAAECSGRERTPPVPRNLRSARPSRRYQRALWAADRSSSLPTQLPRALPGSCPRGVAYRGRASPCGRVRGRRCQVEATSSSPAVPPACHKQRSPAVCSGQSRSLGEGGWAGRTPLTWDGGEARNCMACKGSGVQIPSAPPQVSGPLRRRPPANRPPRAANWQQSALKGRSNVQ